MFMNFSCIHTIPFFPLILLLIGTFLLLSLSLSDSLRMAPKHKSASSRNPLRSRASSSSNSNPPHVRFCDKKARQDFSENFFRRGIHLERQVILSDFFDTDLPTIIHNKGWESLCDILVNCPSVIIQEFYSNMHRFDYSIPRFLTSVQGIHIVVTPELIFDVLHVLRISHPDYPSCRRLWTMSKDELMSLFCKTSLSWGDYQNTPYSGFAKGLRFLNMVMTFVLHPLLHYNSIIEPYAWFLLSFIKDLTIDFPSHFILPYRCL